MKLILYKTLLMLAAGLAIVAAQAYSNLYTDRVAARILSETFVSNCIPATGGKALVRNEAGKLTCEKHETLGYGQARRAAPEDIAAPDSQAHPGGEREQHS